MAGVFLKDAVIALRDRVKALADSAEPSNVRSSENLAYLGNALQSVAGQVSVIEFQQISEDLTALFQQVAFDKMVEVNTSSEAAIGTISDFLADLMATANQAETDFNDNYAARVTQFDANFNTRTTTFNDNATAKTTAYDTNAAAKTASLAGVYADQFTTPVGPTAFIVNANGYYTSFSDGRGRAYTLMTYDTLNRLKTWRETITLPDGTKPAFDYTATYVGNESTPTLTRVAVAA